VLQYDAGPETQIHCTRFIDKAFAETAAKIRYKYSPVENHETRDSSIIYPTFEAKFSIWTIILDIFCTAGKDVFNLDENMNDVRWSTWISLELDPNEKHRSQQSIAK